MSVFLTLLWSLLRANMVSSVLLVLRAGLTHKIAVSLVSIPLIYVMTCCNWSCNPVEGRAARKIDTFSLFTAWPWVPAGSVQLCEREGSDGLCSWTHTTYIQGITISENVKYNLNFIPSNVWLTWSVIYVLVDGQRRSGIEFGLDWMCSKYSRVPARGPSWLQCVTVSQPRVSRILLSSMNKNIF